MLHQLHDWVYHMAPAGGIPLKGTGIVVGLALILSHIWALLRREPTQAFLKDFPRSYFWGVVLLTVALAWSMVCMSYMDMGEFHTLRDNFLMLIPVSYLLVLFFVKEFLAVRALGAVLLYIGGIVLHAAFMQPQASRLLLPIIAYVWIIAGLYFVGMPYLMRDAVGWVTANTARWNLASVSGIAYGVIVLAAAVLWW
jgi:hypothetical protein